MLLASPVLQLVLENINGNLRSKHTSHPVLVVLCMVRNAFILFYINKVV